MKVVLNSHPKLGKKKKKRNPVLYLCIQYNTKQMWSPFLCCKFLMLMLVITNCES